MLDATVEVEFEPIAYSISEDQVMVSFIIVKRSSVDRDISVLFSTEDGSATGKATYQCAATGTLSRLEPLPLPRDQVDFVKDL